jgi:hypothetical protein
MTGHGAKFGRKQEEAIAALLTHRIIEEAATSIGISAKTLLRWMKEREFNAAYRRAIPRRQQTNAIDRSGPALSPTRTLAKVGFCEATDNDP